MKQQYEKLTSESFIITKSMNKTDMQSIKDGKTYLYTHPENIIGNREVYEVLRTNYQLKKCFIVVDEAHCMLPLR